VSVGGAAVESGVRWPPGAAHASRRRAVQSPALPPSLSSLPPARPSARASGCEPLPPLGARRGAAADTDRGFCPQLHAHSQELRPQLHCEDKADRQQAAAHDENPLADAHDALRALPRAEPLELLAAQLQATRMTRRYDVERGTWHAIQYMRRTRHHARTRTHSTAKTRARARARAHARTVWSGITPRPAAVGPPDAPTVGSFVGDAVGGGSGGEPPRSVLVEE
jgi:hypothetical protein